MQLNSIYISNSCNSLMAVPLAKKQLSFSANTERVSFYPETLDTIESVYKDYKKSLCETSISDIKSTSLKLSQELQLPQKEVLKAMQLVTQFSNMKSLTVISENINKHNLSGLGDVDMCLQFYVYGKGLNKENSKLFFAESGIHRSLSYIFNKKGLAPVKYDIDGPIGIILDEEKISQLEKIKQTQPFEYEKVVKNKDLKFFYISGWDTGIPVVNRTKSLEDVTRNLLNKSKELNKPVEKVLDASLLDRIKNLGLKPVIIKNENPTTELGVYNQMKSPQMSKLHLINLIEANTIVHSSWIPDISESEKVEFNDVAAKYLEDTLCVYTPEKMSADLKKMHEKIMDYANSQGKDVLYIRPEKRLKSLDYINYSYKKINNIEPSKFVSIYSLLDYNELYPEKPPVTPENTLLVFLDDCTISGDSIAKIRKCRMFEARVPKGYSALFANLKGTDIAYKNFYKLKKSNPADLIILDKINLKSLQSDKNLKKVVGAPSYSNNASSVVFPYMAPDNNSEIASNIALLHNLKYLSQNFSADKNRNIRTLSHKYYSSWSKTMSSNVKETSVNYINIMGLNPATIEREPALQKEKSIWEKLKSIIGK